MFLTFTQSRARFWSSAQLICKYKKNVCIAKFKKGNII